MFRLRQGCHFESNAWANMPGDPMIVTYPQVIPPTPPALDIWASGAANKGWIFRDVGLGDMCNTYSRTFSFTDNSPYPSESTAHREATDYANRTGYYWISLAPDATNDNATFPSAEAALKAMLPLYRVGISTSGNVKVIRVRTTNYEGKNFDTAITGSDWEDKNKVWGKSGSSWTTALPTAPNYNDHLLWEANGKPRGSPVFDVVMPEMLRDRKWWWDN
jgi:hypothetical protein